MNEPTPNTLTPEQRAEAALPCWWPDECGFTTEQGSSLCPNCARVSAVTQAIRDAEQAAVAKDRERVLRLLTEELDTPFEDCYGVAAWRTLRTAIAEGKEAL